MGIDFLDMQLRIEDVLGFEIPWSQWEKLTEVERSGVLHELTAADVYDFVEQCVAERRLKQPMPLAGLPSERNIRFPCSNMSPWHSENGAEDSIKRCDTVASTATMCESSCNQRSAERAEFAWRK